MHSVESSVIGIHAVEELLRYEHQQKNIDRILVAQEKKHPAIGKIIAVAKQKKIAVQFVPEVKIEKLAKGKTHQGVLAIVTEIDFFTYNQFTEHLKREGKTASLIVLLDRITDVRNFGAIARSAYVMGADALLVPDKGSAQINTDAIKTSSGALLKIPVCREQFLTEIIQRIKKDGFQIIACHEKTAAVIEEVDFKKPTLLVLGSEHNGISKEYLRLCDKEVKIPMVNPFDSLNVSVSAGIALYEIVRQRTSL